LVTRTFSPKGYAGVDGRLIRNGAGGQPAVDFTVIVSGGGAFWPDFSFGCAARPLPAIVPFIVGVTATIALTLFAMTSNAPLASAAFTQSSQRTLSL
jgi:hypothetical protein